jgi:hypothetical protein
MTQDGLAGRIQKSDQREEPNEHGQKALDYEVRRSGSINMLSPS